MTRWRLAALGVLLASAAPATLYAQPTSPTQGRTGPQAAPPPLPAYEKPPAPSPPASAAPTPAPPMAAGPLTEVRVASEGPHGAVRPPRAWRPPADLGGLRLDHRPGEDLDEAWVRRQFSRNGLPGPDGGVSRALSLVQLINRAYLSAGFINSGLVVRPSSGAGVLELRIIYGGLVPPAEGAAPFGVEFADGHDRGLNTAYVRDRIPAAFRRPLSAIGLERDFRLLAEDPAIRTVNADLRPGSRPGEASLLLRVYPQARYDLYVTAANNRSPSVGGERLAAGGSMRNALFAGDLVSGEVGVTRGLEDAAFGYSLPVFSPAWTLSLRGALDNAAVIDDALDPLDIKARDRSVEAGLTRKLIDAPLLPGAQPGRWSPAQTLTAGVLVTHRVSKTYLLGEPFSFSPGSVRGRSEYTALRLTGDYVVRNVDQVFALSLTGTLGLDGSRSDVPGVPSPKQDFHALLAQLNYARRLSDKGLEVRARLSGQITDSVLYSGERFSAGGETTVRGYRENLLLADKGLLGSVEVAQPFNLSRRQAREGFDWGAFTVSAFADGATLRNARPPQPERRIYSVGASLAWTPADALFARLTYGKALNEVNPAGKEDIQDRGLSFRLTVYPLRWRH